MVATMARLRHAGESGSVVIKHKAWEDSGAYPKHARAERWTKGAMEKLVGEQGSHGGTADVDGGVPVATVDENVTQ